MAHRAEQRKVTVSHINLHLPGVLGPLPYVCHRLVSSSHSTAASEYILTIPDTQMQANQVIRFSFQSGGVTGTTAQRAANVPESQQPETSSRQLRASTHCLSPLLQHLSSLFGKTQSVMNHQQMNTPQPFIPSDQQQHTTSPPSSKSLLSSQTIPSEVIRAQSAAAVDLLHLPTRGPFQDHC